MKKNKHLKYSNIFYDFGKPTKEWNGEMKIVSTVDGSSVHIHIFTIIRSAVQRIGIIGLIWLVLTVPFRKRV